MTRSARPNAGVAQHVGRANVAAADSPHVDSRAAREQEREGHRPGQIADQDAEAGHQVNGTRNGPARGSGLGGRLRGYGVAEVSSRIRRTMSSPICEAWNLIIVRDPKSDNSARTRRRTASSATATATVPDGLLRRSARRPGDAGDADAKRRSCARPDAFGERRRDRLAHGAVRFDQRRRNTGEFDLQRVAVRDDATQRRMPSFPGCRSIVTSISPPVHDSAAADRRASGRGGVARRSPPSNARRY